MRVFISSVRAGLEEERDSLPGLIKAMGHTSVRFEDFTAQTVPSREACLNAVASSDVYLLLLGPNYGTPFPDSAQSPTQDEWTAAAHQGLPRVVFRKNGSITDERQQAFEASLGDYRSGRFWKSFDTTADLLSAVAGAIRQLEADPETLTFDPLTTPVTIRWFELGSTRTFDGTRPQLEIHVAALNGQPLSARVLDQIEAGLPARVRASTMVADSVALKTEHASGEVQVLIPEPEQPRRQWNNITYDGHLSGVRVRSDSQVSVRFQLPGDSMGAIYDPQDVTARIAAALRLVGQIGATKTPHVAIAVGISATGMVSLGTAGGPARTSASMPGDRGPIRVDPDEAISRAVLDQGAGEVAVTLGRALTREFTTL